MQLISSSVLSMASKVAIKLGVFEIVQSAGPGRGHSTFLVPAERSVLQGENPFTNTHGMNINEYLRNDTRFGDVFKVAMIEYNKLFVEEMLKSYRGFDGLNSLVDVGSGNGFILHSIVSKYPSIKGIENVTGDAFETVRKGNAIFIKLLKNCYEALPAGGKVIAVQTVIPDANVSYKSVYQFDVYTLSMNEGAKDRTEKEYESLAKEAGFSSGMLHLRFFGHGVLQKHVRSENFDMICMKQ
ncbi:Zinc transporter of isoform 1 [Hibiscus syriacus]|uniref:Zinc transporter of isoform 1 n=1 Tax=Hibiscus syriacus TaxID=106335 RepID=A0A6A3CIR0_HIBSY|nr:Zinc transporter of isoform 1 [Hibiscus syriacus]